MNPNTGEFFPDDGTIPEDWPRFTKGEQVEVKGHDFQIKEIDTKNHRLVLESWNKAMIEKLRGVTDKISELERLEKIRRNRRIK